MDFLGFARQLWHWLTGSQLALGVFIGLTLARIIQKAVDVFIDRRAEDYKHGHAIALQNEKARLDFYNRRFDILTSLYDFYDEMISWKKEPDARQIAARKRFHRATQEAEFLFIPESGIDASLKKLFQEGIHVIAYKENPDLYKSDPQMSLDEFNRIQNIQIKVFDDELKKLKCALHDYLYFARL